jgi:hemoglobin-like flavoprotein
MDIDEDILISSIAILLRHSEQFVNEVYENQKANANFFKEFPAINEDEQKEIFKQGIFYILNRLEDPENLAIYLQELGLFLHEHGLDQRYYSLMKASFLNSFKKIHKNNWSDEYEVFWKKVIGYTLDNMFIGSQESQKVA